METTKESGERKVMETTKEKKRGTVKDFFRNHMVVFLVVMVFVVLLSNLVIGFLQTKCDSLIGIYIIEAACKCITALLPLILMKKWGFVKRADGKGVWKGILAGIPFLLYMMLNLLPLVLVDPISFQVYGGVVVAIILAKTATGLMEESGVRGVLLPMLCEKWQEKSGTYMKAAIVSSILFGCVHLSWSVRQIVFYRSISLSFFLGNLSQVFFTFCFGMLAAGITLYAGSLIPAIIWHSFVAISAYISVGLMPDRIYSYYYENNLLTMQRVLEKYGILSGIEHGYVICEVAVDLLVLAIGILLIRKREKRI